MKGARTSTFQTISGSGASAETFLHLGHILIRQGLHVLHIGGVVLDLREGAHTGQHGQHALERRGEEDGVTGGGARGRGSPDTGRGWGRK